LPSSAASLEQDGLPTPQRYWAMLAVWLGLAMAVLDGAIANVALPTIARDLGTDPASSIWVINAYQLAMIVALLPLASLGDKIGYRRVYVAGLAVFTLGSMACALADSLGWLTAARVLQGLGAAGVTSINTALIRFTIPQRWLGRAIGLNAVVISIAAAVGPTLASAILAGFTWPWLFAINVPIGLLAIAVGARFLPRPPGSGGRLDIPAAVLNVIAFGGLVLGVEGLIRQPSVGSGLALAAGAVAGVVLVRLQKDKAAPMIPIDLLRIRPLRLSILTSVVSFTAQMLAFVALPFYLQGQLGRSVVETGLLLTPWPIAVGVAAPISGRLADRYPTSVLSGLGLTAFAVGLALLALLPAHPGDLAIIAAVALCGVGFGFFQSPNNRTIVSSAPRARSGAVGGLLGAARLLGQTSGAVAMAMLFHLTQAHATVTALWSAAAIGATAAIFSLIRVRSAP
jgi:DHA2 family multidrug resistance protein-like MFS transporter